MQHSVNMGPPPHTPAQRRLRTVTGHLRRTRSHQDPTYRRVCSVSVKLVSHATRGTAAAALQRRGVVAPSDIVFGCSPIGPRSSAPTANSNGRGDTRRALADHESATPAIHAALEAGVRMFDTAPLYGDCEDRLGEALASSPLGSEAAVITKCVVSVLARSAPIVMCAPAKRGPAEGDCDTCSCCRQVWKADSATPTKSPCRKLWAAAVVAIFRSPGRACAGERLHRGWCTSVSA